MLIAKVSGEIVSMLKESKGKVTEKKLTIGIGEKPDTCHKADFRVEPPRVVAN